MTKLKIRVPRVEEIHRDWTRLKAPDLGPRYRAWISPCRRYVAEVHEEDGDIVWVIDRASRAVVYVHPTTIRGLLAFLGITE